MRNKNGFTLIEALVVTVILGIIASIVIVSLNVSRAKARDARRKIEISQMGRFLSATCYLPNNGAGEYDLVDLIDELIVKYPRYVNVLSRVPRDPKSGTDTESFYKYIITDDGKDCALYANLENDNEPVTIDDILTPTAGGGTGTLMALSDGWNKTPIYFQVSN